jgi:signal transduction histidine kinase
MPFAKPAWLNSLSVKLLLAYVLGVALSIILVTLAIFWYMFAQSHNFASKDVAALTQEMAKNLHFDANGNPIRLEVDEADNDGDDDIGWVFDSLKQEAAYRILDASGRTVVTSAAGDEFWPQGKNTTANELKSNRFEFQHNGALILGNTARAEHQGNTWYLQLAISERFHYLLHQGVALPFMGMGIVFFSLVLLVVFGACAYITLNYTLKPLRDVSESAAAISPRSLHARLHVKKLPSEIAPLVNSFNRVLDRLEQGYRTQQEFLATAAHELKTPLALIRAQIEMNEPGEDRDALLNDVAHMTRHVQQLLMLAEVSEEHNYRLDAVDVAAVAREVAAYLQPMAKAAQVQVSVTHAADVNWQADRAALFVLLKNLLENALQHAPRATEVSIDINNSTIHLRDWGPGVEPEQLAQLFVRFWRAAHRRDHGAGLGLAICQEIALAHGWTLSAQSVEPGLSFTLDTAGRAEATSA